MRAFHTRTTGEGGTTPANELCTLASKLVISCRTLLASPATYPQQFRISIASNRIELLSVHWEFRASDLSLLENHGPSATRPADFDGEPEDLDPSVSGPIAILGLDPRQKAAPCDNHT